jgi:hypothetical protein
MWKWGKTNRTYQNILNTRIVSTSMQGQKVSIYIKKYIKDKQMPTSTP